MKIYFKDNNQILFDSLNEFISNILKAPVGSVIGSSLLNKQLFWEFLAPLWTKITINIKNSIKMKL